VQQSNGTYQVEQFGGDPFITGERNKEQLHKYHQARSSDDYVLNLPLPGIVHVTREWVDPESWVVRPSSQRGKIGRREVLNEENLDNLDDEPKPSKTKSRLRR